MALYYELPVYKDTYKLIIKIFEYTKDFSREYKYTLGQDMKRDALQLVRSIYRANKSANKKEHLLNYAYISGGHTKFVFKRKPVRKAWLKYYQ